MNQNEPLGSLLDVFRICWVMSWPVFVARASEMYHLAKACGFEDGREEPGPKIPKKPQLAAALSFRWDDEYEAWPG